MGPPPRPGSGSTGPNDPNDVGDADEERVAAASTTRFFSGQYGRYPMIALDSIHLGTILIPRPGIADTKGTLNACVWCPPSIMIGHGRTGRDGVSHLQKA